MDHPPLDKPGGTDGEGDSSLRAGDADREQATAVLKTALVDGRLTADELDERLALVYTAATTGELASVIEDVQANPTRRTGTVTAPAPVKDNAVLSSFTRKGHWRVGETYRGTAVVSTGVIDLRNADLTSPETTIHANAVISTIYVIVPEDADVHVQGTGILGGFKQDREGPTSAAAHRITIAGTAFCGNVYVVRQPPGAIDRRALKRARRSIG